MDKDIHLETDLKDLESVIAEHKDPEVKKCALNIAQRVKFISNHIYANAKTSEEGLGLYKAAKADIKILSDLVQDTRNLLGVSEPTFSMVEAYKLIAAKTVDKIAENEKVIARNGFAGSTIFTLLIALLQNVPANTNAKIKWGLIGVGSLGVLGMVVSSTFFLHGDKSDLKKLIVDLSNAVLRIIDSNYRSLNEILPEPSAHLRNSFLRSQNEVTNKEGEVINLSKPAIVNEQFEVPSESELSLLSEPSL